jgi:hypothetical protein
MSEIVKRVADRAENYGFDWSVGRHTSGHPGQDDKILLSFNISGQQALGISSNLTLHLRVDDFLKFAESIEEMRGHLKEAQTSE